MRRDVRRRSARREKQKDFRKIEGLQAKGSRSEGSQRAMDAVDPHRWFERPAQRRSGQEQMLVRLASHVLVASVRFAAATIRSAFGKYFISSRYSGMCVS